MHVPPAVHVRSFAGRKGDGSVPSCCQLAPKSVLWADQMAVPSLTMTVQSDGLAQVTLESTRAFWGDMTGDQVAPPSVVVTTTPLPGNDAPLEPTAMQSVGVGHEMPLSCGVLPPATRWAFHETPPLSVAAITVAPVGGAGLGPAVPTAQQRFAVAQETAARSPVLLGAGWPTANGLPLA